MSNDLYSIPLRTIDGRETTLADWQNSVILVVNVASQCGLTKQYEGLEALYETYKARGFVVLGFPSNEFAGQEPGSDEEIQTFCRGTFGVQFPMFSKIEVNGMGRHPLYRLLIEAQPQALRPDDSEFYERRISRGQGPAHAEDILWNFEKFLINRQGQVIQRFSPDMTPDDTMIVNAITRALAE
ncbi:glutathione peroxidase [Prodigiosinella confusarubida]|uniref:Thioredoxin/glutathione peroxidase BtuE n=1 Tax=Serratia sp. (strain ATCC 39006) TaxID=104623 RepID=A0A2I5T7G5_SERS3|nr:glutathione peroxidase [Serratia sp. ATCC 39006]AUH00452.1 glutathione peroxidase [Serratia sp. ATCC 39006]AUH04772.1 glutathione peroxidase [Serratia sp. ATCC 39006]